MPTSNVVTSEGQVTFKRTGGHNHDGLTSTLIDTSKYSIFDFVVTENAIDSSRRSAQNNRKEMLKSFIISTVEERVLNPAGIRIQANTISAREIMAGTITANELSSNIILVNNVIKSNNYNGTITNGGVITAPGSAGWAITSAGFAEFANTSIRGNLTATSLAGGTIDIGGNDSSSFHVDVSGQLWLGGATYTDAPFRLSATGILRSRFLYENGSSFTTTLSSATFRSQFYDAQFDTYASYSVGPTQLAQTGYWSGSSNLLLDADIRERIIYQTNGIFWDGRSAQGGTYSNVGSIYVERGNDFVRGVLQLQTKNNNGAVTGNVDIYDGTVYATTFDGNATTATYANTAGLRSGRILDVDAITSGQDFIIANGNGTGVLRVATNAGVFSKVVSGRVVNVISTDLIGTEASTARLKQNIEPYIFNEQGILSIEPKRFKYNEKVEGGGDDSSWRYGFIAEEAVAAGLSELCGFDEEGLPEYFAYEKMCVAQQQIIRTLWSKVESLEARIQTLEGV